MGASTRRYRVGKVLGKGGFGTVYQAEMVGAGGFVRPVALKVLNPGVAADDETAIRLRDEARLLGRLSHRAIVQVLGLVQLGGSWTVVMELVGGANLHQVRSALGRLPQGIVLEVVQEVARALHVAWGHPLDDGSVLRVLHRDIKPSNIQLTLAGEVKVLDWGVARGVLASREARTQSMVLGSAGYLSPERLMGVDSHAGDVYALTVVLCELLTGTRVHAACTRSSLHAAMVADTTRELARHVSDPRIVELAQAGLAWDPEARPTADELHHRALALRRDAPDPLLPDWAWSTLPGVIRRRSEKDGDLTGRDLVETWSAPVETPDGHSRLDEGPEQQVAEDPGPPSDGAPVAPQITRPPAPEVDPPGGPEVPTSFEALSVHPAAPAGAVRLEAAGTGDVPQPRRPGRGVRRMSVLAGIVLGLVLLVIVAGRLRPRPGSADPPATPVPPAVDPAEPAVPLPVAPPAVDPASPANGRIAVGGPFLEVAFQGPSGWVDPGEVPAGRYQVHADFGKGAGLQWMRQVDVPEGGRVTVRCDPEFERCAVETVGRRAP